MGDIFLIMIQMAIQKKRDKQNVGQLISENTPLLKAFIRRRVSNTNDADDILQDVFFQLVKTVDEAMSPIEQVTSWLYRVARNTIINKGKKKTEEKLSSYTNNDGDEILEDFAEILFNNESSSPETEYMRSLVWEELEVALSQLPPEQQEAFELMEMEGLPAKEAAEIMGVPVNTLLSRKHYAVKHLRICLKELYNDLISD